MNTGVLFLSKNDFGLQQGKNGNLLVTGVPGLCLVVFFSPRCPHSNNLIPIIKKLPTIINGCSFGILNVGKNNEIIGMSRNSITPINYVPMIILYVNQKPYMLYDGPHTEKEITEFVMDVASKLPSQSREKFVESKQAENPSSIPAYSLGTPLFGKKTVTYLTEITAYKNQ
jgi:hypothetical protein